MHASEYLLRGQHQNSKTNLYRPRGLPLFGFEFFLNVLYFSGFSNVISTRETGTQHMLLIDPDDEEEEHGRKYKKV